MAFLQGLQIGANIGNMRVAQQERMMQLRSQAALNAIHERQLAAQADMLAQHASFYRQQADKLEEQQKNESAFGAAVGDVFQKHINESMDPETGEIDMPTAVARTGAVLSKFSPELANKFVQAQSDAIRAGSTRSIEAAQIAAQSREKVAGINAQNRLDVEKAKSQHPKIDSFGQAWDGYQKALGTGDEEAVRFFQGRLQKLSGQLPSAALREGEDLANKRLALDRIEQGLKEDPNDLSLQSEKKRLQTIIDSMESRHGQEEISVSTPGGPEVRITKGGKKEPGAITQAETTRYGEDIQSTGNALRSLNRLSEQLSKGGAVGIGPKIAHTLFDEYLAQIDPEVANKNRAAARENIVLGTQQVLGELNNKGRMSVQELNAIKAAMPSLGTGESDPNAMTKLNELRIALAEKNAASAVLLKRPVSSEAIQALSEVFPATPEGEKAMAEEVRGQRLAPNVALQVRKWQKSKGM